MICQVDIVLILVANDADDTIYELFESHFVGEHWAPVVLPISEVGVEKLKRVAAVVAHALDWSTDPHSELLAIREVYGNYKRILALLPKPPETYPTETQAIWNAALGYGFTFVDARKIVTDMIAGRI